MNLHYYISTGQSIAKWYIQSDKMFVQSLMSTLITHWMETWSIDNFSELFKVLTENLFTNVHIMWDLEKKWFFKFNLRRILQEFLGKNLTFDSTQLYSVFPTGDYKMFFMFTNKFDESIFNITIVASFKSSNQDTFGR